MRYHGFISYSHESDRQLAPALQSALHQFARPWHSLRSCRIFRDRTVLGVAPRLWNSIVQALDQTGYLLLLASPLSAKSKWVVDEVTWWVKHRSPERLLIIWTDGQLAWGKGDFDWQKTDALPEALRGV